MRLCNNNTTLAASVLLSVFRTYRVFGNSNVVLTQVQSCRPIHGPVKALIAGKSKSDNEDEYPENEEDDSSDSKQENDSQVDDDNEVEESPTKAPKMAAKIKA